MLDGQLIFIIFCLTIPIISFISGLIVMYAVMCKCMTKTMSLAYKIKANMPYDNYDEIDIDETGV